MRALINYGVSFSLDDFGNGQSNLNYIVDMPVHIVKFDRDMTQARFRRIDWLEKYLHAVLLHRLQNCSEHRIPLSFLRHAVPGGREYYSAGIVHTDCGGNRADYQAGRAGV